MPEINTTYPKRMINPMYLQDIITLLCWLDEEHQQRAVSSINSIVQDQVAESRGVHKAI